jgi:hypothetical protein
MYIKLQITTTTTTTTIPPVKFPSLAPSGIIPRGGSIYRSIDKLSNAYSSSLSTSGISDFQIHNPYIHYNSSGVEGGLKIQQSGLLIAATQRFEAYVEKFRRPQ